MLCGHCKKDLPDTSFPPSALRSAKKWCMCNPCRNAYYQRRRDEAPPGWSTRHLKAQRLKRSEWIAKYKSDQGCVTCGERHPAALDFHHRDPKTKTIHIRALIDHAAKISRIETEIAKCDVLCSNCHRKLHYHRGMDHWGKKVIDRHEQYAALNLPPEKQRAARGIHRRSRPEWEQHLIGRFAVRF